jgi:hypothetical protein
MVAVPPGFKVVDCALTVKSQAVPVREIVCGLPAALSAILSVAAWLPLLPDGGVNVTLITQVLPGVTTAPLVHVVPLARAKSAAAAPESDGAVLMVRFPFPVFFTVTACAALVVVTS